MPCLLCVRHWTKALDMALKKKYTQADALVINNINSYLKSYIHIAFSVDQINDQFL